MNSRVKTILFALTIVLLSMPSIQQHTGLFHCKPLKGVTEAKFKPELNYQSLVDGSYQKDNEDYLMMHYGFREPLTRLYNQAQWTLFRHSKVIDDQQVMITRDNWMFETWTVEEYYQSRAYNYTDDSLKMAQMFEEEAQRLLKLQKALEPYNTHLFVALLPGKEQICSEHIPKNTLFNREKKLTAYGFYSKRLKELGINHVDFADWFMQMKDTVSYPLFPQTGTHWSNLAAIHVADSLVRYMEDLADINMVNILFDKDFQRTIYPDDDLESLLNLVWPLHKQPNRLAYAYTDSDSTAVHPTLITIGDSFYWNILNLTPVWDVFSRVPFWYYFSTAYFDSPDGSDTKVADKDILQEVKDADFVMIAYSTVGMYRLGSGFSEQLIKKMGLDNDFEKKEIQNEEVQDQI